MNERELLIRGGIAFAGMLFAYLLTSFVQLSFNIGKWSEEARLITALCGTGFGLIFATYPGFKFKK